MIGHLIRGGPLLNSLIHLIYILIFDRVIMGDWKHREEVWFAVKIEGDYEQVRKTKLFIKNNEVVEVSAPSARDFGFPQIRGAPKAIVKKYKKASEEWMNHTLHFSEWLDFQCKDGWELFKIFRDVVSHDAWGSYGYRTCIFRKK